MTLDKFFAAQRNKDIAMSCESLEADIRRLRFTQMSDWTEVFHRIQSLNCSMERVMLMWGENKMFLQDDSGELFRHVTDISYNVNQMKEMFVKMCQQQIRGLDVATDGISIVRHKASDEYVAIPQDYIDWLSNIEDLCKPAQSGWEDAPLPTLHEVQDTGEQNGSLTD